MTSPTIREVLEELIESDYKEHPNCPCDGCKDVREKISQAEARIREIVLLPKKEIPFSYPIEIIHKKYLDMGYNQAIDDITAKIKEG